MVEGRTKAVAMELEDAQGGFGCVWDQLIGSVDQNRN
jgi:hypothetical protein